MKGLRFLPVFFLFLDGCIDPLAVKLPANTALLVVDGMITNEPGPYSVSLFYSSNLETGLSAPQYESGANVSILDDLGETELMDEVSAGVYETKASGMQGQVGRTYYLNIKTRSGEQFRSTPQKLMPSGQVSNLSVEFEKDGIVLDDLSTMEAFSVYIDGLGVDNSPNFYRWRWTGTYLVKTFPELRQIFTRNGPIPDPDPCSGYIVQQGFIKQVAPCTCCICWTNESSTRAIISGNRNVGDRNFNKVLVAKLPVGGLRFYDKYHMTVEQLSVSEDAFEFWKLVDSQQKAAGSLFQPNSVRVRGNISCLTDPDREVLGLFSASGITRISVFMDSTQLPFPKPPLPVIPFSCLESLKNGTTDKPVFW